MLLFLVVRVPEPSEFQQYTHFSIHWILLKRSAKLCNSAQYESTHRRTFHLYLIQNQSAGNAKFIQLYALSKVLQRLIFWHIIVSELYNEEKPCFCSPYMRRTSPYLHDYFFGSYSRPLHELHVCLERHLAVMCYNTFERYCLNIQDHAAFLSGFRVHEST